jgi:hypothetical protein
MLFGRNDIFKVCQKGSDADLLRLIEKGADLGQRDGFGRTPLHVAAGSGMAHLVRILVDHGADKAARDHEGKTALDRARERFEQIRDGIDEAYAREAEDRSVRLLMRTLVSLMQMRRRHPAIEEETSRLAAIEFDDVSQERIAREMHYADQFMPGIRGYGDVSRRIITMMGVAGPRQVAYRLLLMDTERVMDELAGKLL